MQNNRKKMGKTSLSYLLRTAMLGFALMTTSAYSASKTVLVLGDSLSAEYGLPRGSGWVSLMEKRIGAEKLNLKVVNASISGETTSGGKTRLPALINQYHPSVVIIELGANDGLRGLPLATTESNLRAMVGNSQASQAKVLLVGMQLPPNYGHDYVSRFSHLYEKIAHDSRTALVPFLFNGIADKEQLFQADGLHPTEAAQPTLLNNVWPHLRPLLVK